AKYGTSEVNWEKYKSLLSSKQSNVQRLCGEKLKEFSNLKDIVAGAAKAEAFYRCAVELRLDSNYGKPKLLSNNKEYDGLALYNKGILEKIFNVENGIIFHNISQWCGLSQLEKGEDEFVKWYVKNGSQCAYCKSSILDLLRFYVKNTTKRNRGLSWEVDHRKPDGSFCEENCALVCHYCNNAKSDIFKSSDEFRLIGNAIGQQIAEILTPAA
ncbi:MAG TPA: HNH endonuclease signature motif containing protein, partial [Candidatus Omnitrophota bacterium]|nr:HNH endonuclease signature motif containing protein [Candidatus Omnitrophota bacterium]